MKLTKKKLLILLAGLLAVGAAVAAVILLWSKANDDSVHMIGHRGYSAVAPENTLPAFRLAGDGRAPCQRVGDLLHSGARSAFGEIRASYRPGIMEASLRDFLPVFVVDSMREALPLLGRKMRGFDDPAALLTGPETRSSSPVRMPRDQRTVSIDCAGLHPCGEGAGYAGGITSAAVDGLRCASAVLEELSEETP